MSVEGLVIDGGFLGIFGFGVWRGQNLWSRHIELKHEREMERLGMDRMEKSIRLEIDQNMAMAEIERMHEVPALGPGKEGFNAGTLPWVCGCTERPSWHLHAAKEGKACTLPLSLGAIESIRDGEFAQLCVCGEHPESAHRHPSKRAEVSLSSAGYEVRR